MAAERLHTVLGLYNAQNLKLDRDPDSCFAHAVDEALGYHKELAEFTGTDNNSVLAVLTKAETFVKWLAIEKKCKWSLEKNLMFNCVILFKTLSDTGSERVLKM